MSKNEIVSMIETMNNYDELASKAKAKADAIRDALKEEMLRLDTEELNAGAYILRYTNIISNRFDTTTFKRLYADLYILYLPFAFLDSIALLRYTALQYPYMKYWISLQSRILSAYPFRIYKSEHYSECIRCRIWQVRHFLFSHLLAYIRLRILLTHRQEAAAHKQG